MKKLLFLLICLCVVLSGCGNPDLWTDSYKDKIPKTTQQTITGTLQGRKNPGTQQLLIISRAP